MANQSCNFETVSRELGRSHKDDHGMHYFPVPPWKAKEWSTPSIYIDRRAEEQIGRGIMGGYMSAHTYSTARCSVLNKQSQMI